MKIKSIDLSQWAQHKHLRNDVKYWQIQDDVPFVDFVLLKDLFDIINGSVQTKYYTTEKTDIPYIRGSDIDSKFGIVMDDLIYLNDECKIQKEKILRENDLIMATIGTVGKVGIANKVVGGTISNNLVILRAKNQNLNVGFYEKLFQTDFYIQYLFKIAAQKAQPNLQPYDLENVKIPVVSEKDAESAMETVSKHLSHLSSIKGEMLSTSLIIDTVFQNHFSYDYEEFERKKKIKIYEVPFAAYGNNTDTRFSAKFHRPAGEFVYSELKKSDYHKLKDIVSVPMITGQGISNEYDENGTCAYVSMGDISTWSLNVAGLKMVSDAYAKKERHKEN